MAFGDPLCLVDVLILIYICEGIAIYFVYELEWLGTSFRREGGEGAGFNSEENTYH